MTEEVTNGRALSEDQLRAELRLAKDQISGLKHQTGILKNQRDHMENARNGAYQERNMLVAALTKIYPSGLGLDGNFEKTNPQWKNLVLVDLPTGQATWHVHETEMHLFEHLKPYQKKYDGHTIHEKYERLAKIKPRGIVLL